MRALTEEQEEALSDRLLAWVPRCKGSKDRGAFDLSGYSPFEMACEYLEAVGRVEPIVPRRPALMKYAMPAIRWDDAAVVALIWFDYVGCSVSEGAGVLPVKGRFGWEDGLATKDAIAFLNLIGLMEHQNWTEEAKIPIWRQGLWRDGRPGATFAWHDEIEREVDRCINVFGDMHGNEPRWRWGEPPLPEHAQPVPLCLGYDFLRTEIGMRIQERAKK